MLYSKKLNKKGVSEIISFILLTFLIVVTSFSSYYFAKDSFEDIGIDKDSNQMEIFLKALSVDFESLQKYDGSTSTYSFSFDHGNLYFNSSSIYYQSLLRSDSSDLCLDDFCYKNNNGYERLELILTGVTIPNNFTLIPGNYLMSVQYNKTSSELNIFFR